MPRVVPGYRQQAKDRILKEAWTLFAGQGYHATTMDEIAARVGVSRATLYLYFRSKEDLFRAMAVCAREHARITFAEFLSHEDKNAKYSDRFDFLLGMYDGLETFIFEITSLAARNQEIKAILEEDMREDITTYATFIRELQARGRIRAEADPDDLACALTAMVTGMWTLTLFGMDRRSLQRVWDLTISPWLVKSG